MLQWLFLDSGLPEFYDRQVSDDTRRPNSEILGILTTSRRARALDAALQLAKLARTYGGGCFDNDVVVNTIKFRRVVTLDETTVAKGVQMTRCHGDLHTRNVLVGVHDHPRLIDPANIETMPLHSDLARFVADLFISGWGESESHDLTKISEWCVVASAIVQRRPVRSLARSSTDQRVAVALAWIADNFTRIYVRPAPAWQWLLGLAVEFLRCSYRVDLPGPKRVLSLAAASATLSECAAEYARVNTR
jgi:hypothetical protein